MEKQESGFLNIKNKKDLIREPLMGWTGSQDTNEQVKLLFDDVDQAINYAKKIILNMRLSPRKKKYRSKLYSDNFRFDRKDKWTH